MLDERSGSVSIENETNEIKISAWTVRSKARPTWVSLCSTIRRNFSLKRGVLRWSIAEILHYAPEIELVNDHDLLTVASPVGGIFDFSAIAGIRPARIAFGTHDQVVRVVSYPVMKFATVFLNGFDHVFTWSLVRSAGKAKQTTRPVRDPGIRSIFCVSHNSFALAEPRPMSKHADPHYKEHQQQHAKRRHPPHKDWRLWTAVVLMLAAMFAYVISDDEALAPNAEPEDQTVPAAAE